MNGLCRGREVCTWRLIPGCARAFSEMHAGVPSISRSASLGFRLVRPPLARALVLSGLAWPCRSRGRGGGQGAGEAIFREDESSDAQPDRLARNSLCPLPQWRSAQRHRARPQSAALAAGSTGGSAMPIFHARPDGTPRNRGARRGTARAPVFQRPAARFRGARPFSSLGPPSSGSRGGGAAYGPPSPCLPRRLGESLCGAFTFGRGRAHCALQRPRTTPVRKAHPPGASEPVQLP